MVNKTDNSVIACDVVVVGAGLVGLAAAIALADQGKRVVLVDAKQMDARQDNFKQTKTWDSRIYALTPATEDWLQSLGVWPLVKQARVNDVETIALWSPESETPLNLLAEDANLAKLACIVENKNLMQALWQKIHALDVPVMMNHTCHSLECNEDAITLNLENGSKIAATLLVAADGANSFVRQRLAIATNGKSFDQKALVANYLVENDHGNVARQWFSPHSTLALLPLPDKHVSMVWSASNELIDELSRLTEQQLAEQVQAQTNNELGILNPVGEALSFELKQITASRLIAERVVLVGDAAHQVHPMAGQGANLGFRDIIALQALIASSHHLQDIGDVNFLRKYERIRKADILSMNTLTSGLDDWFSRESLAVKKMTVWGLAQLNKYPNIKNILIKQAVA